MDALVFLCKNRFLQPSLVLSTDDRPSSIQQLCSLSESDLQSLLAALSDTALSVPVLNEDRDACESDSDSELGLFLQFLCPLALRDRFFKLFSFLFLPS